MVFQSLQNPRVLRPDISLDDILNEANFLDSVLESMQLSDDLISFVDKIGAYCLHQIKFAKTVGVSHLQDTVQLSKIRWTWLL